MTNENFSESNDLENDEIVQFVRKLHAIPHLKLPLTISDSNLELLRNEANSIADWNIHRHGGYQEVSEAEMYRYSKGYRMVSIFEYNGRSSETTDNYEIFEAESEVKFPDVRRDPATGFVQFQPTELADRMPATVRIVRSITDRIARTRVVKSDPGHILPWHSHAQGKWSHPFMIEGIVQIPIVTNRDVIHAVRDFRNHCDSVSSKETFQRSSRSELIENPNIFHRSYLPGEVWVFNSWHDHFYGNFGNEVRLGIVLFVRWHANPRFMALVKEALAAYDGPTFAPD